MAENVSERLVEHRADSFNVSKEMVAAGLGRALLPEFLGDNDHRLRRIVDPSLKVSFPVWVASLSELASSVRFKTVRSFLVQEIGAALQGLK